MFDSTAGQARENVDITEQDIQKMREAGTLVIDTGRRRPLYFDGRFLAASDLSMEQNYLISRQSSLGQALGGGVVDGLMVTEDQLDAKAVYIEAGHGLTHTGEMVLISEDIVVSLSDIAEAQRLNVTFGLSEIPKSSAANRSGLFIIALRPVEYSAHPIAVYPTSVTGKPASNSSTATGEVITQDGDIVSAVAVSIIPYQDLGTTNELTLRRASAAREIFIEGKQKGVPEEVLPLAMVALDAGVIRWIDNDMVRRLIGNEHRDILGLGFAPRGLREAYFRQYENHLRYIMNIAGQHNVRRMAASDHFFSLPACGPMPTTSINPDNFTQSFFPAEMEVDISIIPDDELAPLINESLLLPPIDLSLSGEDFESTSIMVLVPVSRSRLRTLSAELSSVSRELKTAAPGQNARKNPLETLYELTRASYQAPQLLEGVIGEDAWRLLLAEHEVLWYVRRRNISYRAEIASLPISGSGSAIPDDLVPGDDNPPGNDTPPTDGPPPANDNPPPVADPFDRLNLPQATRRRIELLGLNSKVRNLAEFSNAAARESLTEFLSFDRFRDAPDVMFYAAIDELGSSSEDQIARRISSANLPQERANNTIYEIAERANVIGKSRLQITSQGVEVVWKRFDYDNMGKGISKLEELNDALTGEVYLENLGKSRYVPEFDRLLSEISKRKMLMQIAEKFSEVVLEKNTDQHLFVAEFIQEFLKLVEKESKGAQRPIKDGSGFKMPSNESSNISIDDSLLGEKIVSVVGPGGRESELQVDSGGFAAVENINSPSGLGITNAVAGKVKKKSTDDIDIPSELSSRLDRLNLVADYKKLDKIATNASVRSSLQNFLVSPRISDSQDIILVAVLDELMRAVKKANGRVTKAVMAGIEREFDNEEINIAITRLEKIEPELKKQTDYYKVLGRSSMVPQLANLILRLDKKSELKTLSAKLLQHLTKESSRKLSIVQSFIRQSLKTYKRK